MLYKTKCNLTKHRKTEKSFIGNALFFKYL